MVKSIYRLVVITCSAFSLLMQYTTGGVRANETKSEFDYNNFEFWSEQCRLFDNLQKYTEALEACEKAIALEPKKKNVLLWNTRSNALLKLGKYAEAITSYNQVLQTEPNNSFALTQKCQALSQVGNNEDAILSCEQALRINGNWGNITPAKAWYNRGLALRKSAQNQEAITSFERAILINQDYSLAFAQKCRTLTDLKLYEDAITTCDNAIENKNNGDWGESNPAIAFIYKAQALTKSGKLSESIEAYKKALEINPNDAIIWYEKGKLQQRLAQYNEALASYSMAVQIKPKFSQALARQAEMLNELKNYQQALESSDKAFAGDGIWSDTTLAYLWVQRSTALVNLKKYEESIADAQNAIALNQSYAEAWNNKAVSLWHLGKHEEAEKASQEAVKSGNNNAQTWFNRGRILSSFKKSDTCLEIVTQKSINCLKAADKAYEQALKGEKAKNNNATCAMILTNKGAVLWRLGNYKSARQFTKEAVIYNRNSFEAKYNRGVIFLKLKQYQEALSAYRRADSISPNNPFVLTGIAMAYAGKGNYQEALKAVDKALNINPDYTVAQQQREMFIAKIKANLKDESIENNQIKDNN